MKSGFLAGAVLGSVTAAVVFKTSVGKMIVNKIKDMK